MATLAALLFDVDGTLADTERDGHRPAFNQAFQAAGLSWEWTPELYGELLVITGGKERIRYYVDRYSPPLPPGWSPAQIDQSFIAGLHQAKNRFYAELLARGAVPLRPGVQRLLKEARDAGLRLAIATTTSPENVTELLQRTLGSASVAWFEVIAAGDIVPAKKPAPDIYHYTLEALKLPPEACIAFEDSENGVKAAVAAHLKTVVTRNEYTLHQAFTGAALIVDDLGEPGRPAQIHASDQKSASVVIDVPFLRTLVE